MNEEIDHIFMRRFGQEELTEEERQALERWTAASDSHARLRRQLEHLLENRSALASRKSQAEAWQEISRRLTRGKKRRRIFKLTSTAAAIALLMAGGWLLYFSTPQPAPHIPDSNSLTAPGDGMAELILPNGEKRVWRIQDNIAVTSDTAGKMYTDDRTLIVASNESVKQEPKYYTIGIPYGAEYNLRLPDGTEIHLNAGTTLRYPDRFTGGKREVFLSGEAYFDVARDTTSPFLVCMEHSTVKVLGTSFNISAYPGERVEQTTLVSGSVLMGQGDAERWIALAPGQQGNYDVTEGTISRRDVDVSYYTSWKNGIFAFDAQPLEQVMKTLARWYLFNVSYEEPALKEILYTGKITRNTSIEEVLANFELTDEIRFDVRGKEIVVKKK